jgi:SAM-dependent methyltransferase
MFSNAVTNARRLSRAPEVLRQMRALWRGYAKWRLRAEWRTPSEMQDVKDRSNPLRVFFDSRKVGHGIWKWNHYFDIYDRHFSRFRDRAVRVLEIGIYSGGSLEMWKEYFGPRCQVYGVDIEPACKTYESDSIKVFIGNQGDRNFWKRFKNEVQAVDIVIDDGSHLPEQQIITFEEVFPYLQPGGIFLCEDVCGTLNTFASYLYGFAHNLNASEISQDPHNNERHLVSRTTPLQSAVSSIHLYPWVTVVEKTDVPIFEFVAPKHGTQWQPFFQVK